MTPIDAPMSLPVRPSVPVSPMVLLRLYREIASLIEQSLRPVALRILSSGEKWLTIKGIRDYLRAHLLTAKESV